MSAALRAADRPALGIAARDRRIVERALAKLAPGGRTDFGEAMRALREAVEESIPSGRVFFLGAAERGPVVGSLITGVGIVESAGGIDLVRVTPGGVLSWLGSFAP